MQKNISFIFSSSFIHVYLIKIFEFSQTKKKKKMKPLNLNKPPINQILERIRWKVYLQRLVCTAAWLSCTFQCVGLCGWLHVCVLVCGLVYVPGVCVCILAELTFNLKCGSFSCCFGRLAPCRLVGRCVGLQKNTLMFNECRRKGHRFLQEHTTIFVIIYFM